jgi:two-component system, cell cycle sensor histidine kinase and response regulator CckA
VNNMPAEKNRRVLVIDDNRAIHDDFRKILSPANPTTAAFDATEAAVFGRSADPVQQAPFEVDSAYQGQEGVQLVKEALEAGRPYAMAFVDVRMPPGWDGVETTRRIWELDSNLQVVLCTAYSDYSWDEMFEKLGQRDGLLILKKPFDAVEALQLAHALTEKWWLHQQSRRKMEELEGMVAERTGELQHINQALQTEVAEHQRVEETLRESEEKFRQLADNVTDVFWMTSPDLRKVHYVSPAYERVWGRSTASVYAHPTEWADAIPAEERERVYAAFSRLEADEPSVSAEFRIARPDGSIRWIHSRGFQIKDATGTVIRITGIATDITERKRSELALQQSQKRLRDLIDGLSPSMFVGLMTPSGILIECNRSALAAAGLKPEDVLGKPFEESYWWAYSEEVQRQLRKTIGRATRGEASRYDVQIRAAENQLIDIDFSLQPLRDESGEVVFLVPSASVITERKRAEESLRLLGSAVEQSKESIVITDAELRLPGPRILFVNPAFTKMTGYTAEEAIGNTPRILQGPRTDRTVLSRLRQNLERGETFAGEAINYRKDGTEFNLEWQVAPLRNAGGNITHFVAIQRDITERKRVEGHLFQSQKMETVGKLAGGIAHEFNTIMTTIIGHSEIMLSDLPAGNPLCKNAQEIRQAADRAAMLTRQLLAYGRKQILQPKILDLSTLIADMEGMLRHLMGGEVDVRIVPSIGLKPVRIDPGQVEQVIMNIAMNAADAMPNGGKLTLETANVTLDEEYVRNFSDLKAGEYVMLAITDTGVGMTEKVKARLFEPFFTTKGVGEGTGLGLATCHGIIKQSGGHIAVYSEPGRGTAFKIYLPQVEQPTKVIAARHDSANLPRGTEAILVVEDDPALREMSAALLRRLGYTVLVAANGVDALKLIHQQGTGHIDLLFTDVVMPQMSGKELSDRIQALRPSTKILFVSAYTENAIVHQGVLDEGVDLLQKPFTPSALALKVREILDPPNPLKSDTSPRTLGLMEKPCGQKNHPG